ncbi:MAG: hypothetical protein IPK18_04655 [Sphingobacteriales bacterium]|jgi:hypothetical protein|nr:MAG: hypothetical protein IPK18_04655 [Sphingobacteriales bacterium]
MREINGVKQDELGRLLGISCQQLVRLKIKLIILINAKYRTTKRKFQT